MITVQYVLFSERKGVIGRSSTLIEAIGAARKLMRNPRAEFRTGEASGVQTTTSNASDDLTITRVFHDSRTDSDYATKASAEHMERFGERGRATGKVYEYVLLLRPFGFATVPSGHIGVRKSIDPKRYPHGVVQYEKPLSRRDIEAFDLMPLDPFDPLNVRRVNMAWRDRVRERFIEGNREMFNVEDDDGKGFRLLTYSTRPGVEFQVTFFTRGRAGKARPEPTGHLDFNDFDKAADSMLTKKARKEIVDAIVPRA